MTIHYEDEFLKIQERAGHYFIQLKNGSSLISIEKTEWAIIVHAVLHLQQNQSRVTAQLLGRILNDQK